MKTENVHPKSYDVAMGNVMDGEKYLRRWKVYSVQYTVHSDSVKTIM